MLPFGNLLFYQRPQFHDLRLISDEQTKTNIEAFIEQLEENR
jgi:hypothetical protein